MGYNLIKMQKKLKKYVDRVALRAYAWRDVYGGCPGNAL